MTRPLRVQYPGAWYHVMNRGAGRRKIFIRDKHREKFLELIDEITSIYGIEIHAYCLMGNHYHLLIRTPLGNLSDGMRFLNSNYAAYLNRSCRSDGAIFRGRYKSIIVSGERYLLRLSRYIHQNPLKAGLISNLEEYVWSSYPSYLEKEISPKWLNQNIILNAFNQSKSEYPMTYREFNENLDKNEIDEFFEQIKIPPVMGDEAFREYINNIVASAVLSPEIIDAGYINPNPKIALIIKSVAEHFQISPFEITNQQLKLRNLPRSVALILCREMGRCSLNEMAEVFGGTTYQAISMGLQRAKKRVDIMDSVKTLKEKVRELNLDKNVDV